ncbi:arylsulfatase A-like enzyme [Wenyingzhuangia heitensis]|uniref:Arylsulfatase A-like enzyme n=1 Tax=Wenyingzhuangia heitensis TaxID=1487859 RepID=A0ABX0UCH6_9FLAO|nr:sulfatase [Wenyingzhuangia heitensis]NIJ45590.1 arylsulfatase A-like enzyme [Wenyingzhuangia heitensis]
MFRSNRVVIAVCLVFAMLFSCKSKSTSSKELEPEKKNILFILADDYGYNDLSFRNNKYYETPNIDRIAKEGTAFNEGYAACRVCSPSRASIMTGTFPARHGITDWIGARSGEKWREKKRFNKLMPAEYNHELNKEATTLPEALKEQGYTTFFAGKWHLGEKGSWPEDHGFDINKGGWDAGGPRGGYFAPFKNPNLEDHQDGENLSMRLAKETVNFMKEHKDQKFFAYLSFYAVHGAIQTSQGKWQKYRNKAIKNGVADHGFEMGHFLPIKQTQDNPVYAGLVESMDDAVGEVLKGLEELGLDKNTIVVFTSDNGGVSAGDSFSTSNLPLRGGKGYQYEGGIKEPYFIKVPWLKNQVKENNTPVTGTDFYPTLLDLVGAELKPESHKDGISLVPLLQGKQTKERPLIWHYPHYGNQGGEPSSIIRLGDWKLIHYYEDDRNELYNITNDLEERNNVVEKHPELATKLHQQLFDYLKDVNANYPKKDPLYSAKKEQEYLHKIATKKLKSLEKQRLNYLKEDFKPNADWWGSKQTID